MAVRQKFASRDCGEFMLTNLATNNVDLKVDYANTFNMNITAETTPALKRGRRAVIFSDPMEGTVEVEMQVYPFEVLSILGDGTIIDGGDRAIMETITATTAGELDLTDEPKNNTVFVFERGGVGGEQIKGSVTTKKFTATESGDIVVGQSYDVSYFTEDETIERVKINDNLQLSDYRIDAEIPQKSEAGKWVPMHIICYKATPQRNIELSYAAEGDPATLTITFDLLTDANNEFVEMYQVRTVVGE